MVLNLNILPFSGLCKVKKKTSCDFIGLNNGETETVDSYEMLLSQVLAITQGKEDKESLLSQSKEIIHAQF